MKKGFTLVELLVVIVVIGILMSLALVSYQATRKSARDAKRKADLQTITVALEAYKSDHGYYPNWGSDGISNPEEWGVANSRDWNDCPDPTKNICVLISEGYLDKLPIDPGLNSSHEWTAPFSQPCGNSEEYVYRASARSFGGEYFLYAIEESKNGADCLIKTSGSPTCTSMLPDYWGTYQICLKSP